MPMLSQHSRGLLLAVLSVIVISPDALLLVEMSSHASPATVLFWKCIAVGCLSLLHGALWNGCHGLRSTLEALPPHRVLTLWTLQAVSVSGFALSVLLTTPARAMIFISLNPVWASLLSVGLGEGLPRRTVGAIVLCVACVLVICSESLHATSRAGSAAGDAVALGTGGAFALYLTALRRTAQRHAAVDLSPLSSGGFLLAAAAVVGAAPLHRASGPALPPIHALPASFWLAAAVDGGLVVCFYAAVVHSSRHITAAEMAMVQLLEYVGGPIVVYAAGRSGRPSGATLCGGLLLLAGLLAHEGLGVLAERGHSLGTWCDAGLPSCGGVPRGAAALFPLGTWQELQGLVRDAEASELVAAPKGLLLHGGPRNWRPSYAPS